MFTEVEGFQEVLYHKLLSELNNKAKVLLLSSLTAEIRNVNILNFFCLYPN